MGPGELERAEHSSEQCRAFAMHEPDDWLRFVQIDPFPRQWSQLGLTDADLRALEIEILVAPSGPPVIPGGNGLRKIRFTSPGSDRGKRGAYRVFYVHFAEHGTVILWAILAKGDKADLSNDDVRFLGQQISRLQSLLDRGLIR